MERLQKPVLATDWDDVCYEFLRHYLPYYNQRHGTSFTEEEVLDYNLAKLLGCETGYLLETIDDFHENGESLPQGLIPSALEVIPELAKDFNIITITARKNRFKHRIVDMIDHYLPGSIQESYFREDYESYGSKGAFLRTLGAIALIDDNKKNILSAEQHGVRGLLRNMPHNIRFALTVERVNDWYDVYEKLQGEPFDKTAAA